MASVFNHMQGGRWRLCRVLFMVFAAMSTVFGVCENLLCHDPGTNGGQSRPAEFIAPRIGGGSRALPTAVG